MHPNEAVPKAEQHTDNQPVISTWIVEDLRDEETQFPQMIGHSSDPRFHAVYWRCAAVFFYGSKIFNPVARHILFTNVPEITLRRRRIDGVELAGILDTLSIEVVTLPLTYRLPRGTFAAFGNQFYILDIIDWLAAHSIDVPCVVLDSDCVWRKPGADLFTDIAAHKALSYSLDGSRNGINNELSNSQLAEILRLWRGRPVFKTLAYTGGEAFAATANFCRQIRGDVHDLWHWTLNSAARKGALFPFEEAHFLTIIYAANGIAPGGLNPYLKRIWSGIRTRNAEFEDVKLTIWHLPWEKRFGIRRLFGELFLKSGGKCEGTVFSQIVSSRCGVPDRRMGKLALDTVQRIAEKMRLRK